MPVIWNKSSGVYYQLGTRKEPEGKARSTGIGINYHRKIYKNFFGKVGIGYFKQVFGIIRPFSFISPDATRPIVETDKYSYNNILINLGIGHEFNINETIKLVGNITYNSYLAYRQQYEQNYFPNYTQVGKIQKNLGKTINLEFGVSKLISKNISFGTSVLLPVNTKWGNDEIFFKSSNSNDSQIAGKNIFSYGINFSINYNF